MKAQAKQEKQEKSMVFHAMIFVEDYQEILTLDIMTPAINIIFEVATSTSDISRSDFIQIVHEKEEKKLFSKRVNRETPAEEKIHITARNRALEAMTRVSKYLKDNEDSQEVFNMAALICEGPAMEAYIENAETLITIGFEGYNKTDSDYFELKKYCLNVTLKKAERVVEKIVWKHSKAMLENINKAAAELRTAALCVMDKEEMDRLAKIASLDLNICISTQAFLELITSKALDHKEYKGRYEAATKLRKAVGSYDLLKAAKEAPEGIRDIVGVLVSVNSIATQEEDRKVYILKSKLNKKFRPIEKQIPSDVHIDEEITSLIESLAYFRCSNIPLESWHSIIIRATDDICGSGGALVPGFFKTLQRSNWYQLIDGYNSEMKKPLYCIIDLECDILRDQISFIIAVQLNLDAISFINPKLIEAALKIVHDSLV